LIRTHAIEWEDDMIRTSRMTRRVVVTTAVCAVLLGATDALAFRMIQNTAVGRVSAGAAVTCTNSGGFAHWSTCNIPWRLNTANQGAGKTAAVQAAMASWTGVSSACQNLTYAGTTTAGFSTDGINTLRWATGSGCTGSCLALTALVLASGQRITETDVTFNNSVTWTTSGSNYDTQTVTAHELGHALGIHHTNLTSTPRPTMYAIYFGSGGRSLEADDRSALQCSQSRYPPSGSMAAESEAGPEVTESAVRLSARPRPGGSLIRYSLEADADVRLDVYDVAGRHMTTLAEGHMPAGDHELAWDGTTSQGKTHAGVYFARIVSSGGKATATVILTD
jgi:hypothetical protein